MNGRKALLDFCIAILVGGLVSLSGRATAEEVPIRRSSSVWRDVPFCIIVDKRDYIELLTQLPDAQIAIDREQLVVQIAKKLEAEGVAPAAGEKVGDIANRVYGKEVEPFLQPRVKAFNETMNQAGQGERVTAGYLSMAGIANSMVTRANSVSSVSVRGTYLYNHGEFENGGRWEWPDEGLIGMTERFDAKNSWAIDETLEISLGPYGAKAKMSFFFHCTGEVKLEQVYGWKFLDRGPAGAGPRTSVRVLPSALVTATKTISSSVACLKVEGKTRHEVTKSFPYPAIMLLEIVAKESNWQPPDTDQHRKK